MVLTVHHRVPRTDLALGIVRVEGIAAGPAPAPLAAALDTLIATRRSGPLGAAEEVRRQGSREMLRNGRYKPTGRGKPASEYLMRAASEGEFPRVNGPVDANNLVSLAHAVPISLWDLELAGTGELEVRLGRPGERYIFNAADQVLELEDLICGAALAGERSRPIVTPIKDSLATKLRPSSRRVGGCIYYPVAAGNREHLEQITAELLAWLLLCGAGASGSTALALPGETVST
jgi:DNA/RNA-binding domain of Phe-tRNA-synthetase-like protein